MVSTVAAELPNEGADHGPGLFDRLYDDGSRVVTNIRVGGSAHRAGSGMINFATGLLFALGIGLFAVSINAQYSYILHVKHEHLVSLIEAFSLDAGMAIFTLLSLGLARTGKSAAIERALILVCALGSAGMNYAAADVFSARSVLAYVVPPIFLAVVVDRVVAVVRRHVLGEQERSPFGAIGKAGLYLTRLAVAPISTIRGARRALLNATPVPEAPKPAEPVTTVPAVIELPHVGPSEAIPAKVAKASEAPRPRPTRTSAKARTATTRTKNDGPSKKQQLLDLVVSEHGELGSIDLGQVYSICKELAPKLGYHEGSARTALRAAILAARGESK